MVQVLGGVVLGVSLQCFDPADTSLQIVLWTSSQPCLGAPVPGENSSAQRLPSE